MEYTQLSTDFWDVLLCITPGSGWVKVQIFSNVIYEELEAPCLQKVEIFSKKNIDQSTQRTRCECNKIYRKKATCSEFGGLIEEYIDGLHLTVRVFVLNKLITR